MHKIIITLLCCLLLTSSQAQKLYSVKGKASYYANKFEGRKTANGEIFSNKKMTAAHLFLPFGTIVKVTNPKNNKSVIVRINDRGPYIKSRVIDLSRTAADSLDIIHSGWANVIIEEVLPESLAIQTELSSITLPDPEHLQFPEDWIGNWRGSLKIYSSRGLEKKIPMELNILNTDSSGRYNWSIVYDAVPRMYELIRRDSANGIFSINEKNGIDIMSTVVGNHFLSRFSIMGNMLDCEYHLLNRDEMMFEIRSGKDDRHWSTGNIAMQSDSIPEVNVFTVTNVQVAMLQRMKD